MASMNQSCIPSDPDISGIGVRAAIYTQNMLSFVPAIVALWDGRVSETELDSIETQATAILITAFSILITTIVQATTSGLTNFHATLVLNLSWMNNTNTFIYFLLYIQFKSQPLAGGEEIPPHYVPWGKHILAKLKELLSRTVAPAVSLCLADNMVLFTGRRQGAGGPRRDNEQQAANPSPAEVDKRRPKWTFLHRILQQFVLHLGSLHLTLMAAVGIWLWSNPETFGGSHPCSSGEIPSVVVVGHPIPITSNGLRVFSIILYSLILAPGLNLIIPMALLLGIYILYRRWVPQPDLTTNHEDARHRLLNWAQASLPILIGLVLLLVINVIFIIDIERTIRENRKLQDMGESRWNFGQILAVLLLTMPLHDVIDIISGRRELEREYEHQRRSELTRKLVDVVEKAFDHTGKRTSAQKEKLEDTIKRLKLEGANMDRQYIDDKSSTVLQLSVKHNDSDLTSILLQCGAYPNTADTEYGTVLHVAVYNDSYEVTQLLLEHGANPKNKGGKYGTPLHIAVKKTSELLHLILEYNPDINSQDDQKQTPLYVTVNSGNLKFCDILLSRGANPNISGGEYGSPLQAACYAENLDIVKLLLQYNADLNTKAGKYQTALQAASFGSELEIVKSLVSKGAQIDIKGGLHGTALQAAVMYKNLDIIKYLLERQADVNITGGESGSALHAACAQQRLEIVKLLIQSGANVNIQDIDEEENIPRESTLHITAQKEDSLEIATFLIESNADVNLQGGQFWTALQAASCYGNLEMVQLLQKNNAKVNIQGGEYGTALIAACHQEHIEIVNLLLENQAEINTQVTNRRFATALQAASCGRSLEVVNILLEHKADIDTQGGEYNTALQAACYYESIDIVRTLLENGADATIQGGMYGSALQAAIDQGNTEIAQLIEEHLAKQESDQA